MSRGYIAAEVRRQIIERASRRCEYCQSPMDYAAQPFVIEHIFPVSKGGETALENLALACGGCNGHKYNRTAALDPDSQTLISLYHPRKQSWQQHFSWSSDYLQVLGLTAAGRTTVQALKMNRPGLLNIRQLLLTAGLHPPS